MKITRENSLTLLNFHIFIVVILAAVNLFLATQLILAWHTLRTDNSEQITQDQATLRTMELQTKPLRGLPEKVANSRQQANALLGARMPSNYSSISAELNGLAQKNNVRLARVQYVQTPAIGDLAEVRMDAGLSGDYTPMMRFINGLERDRMFFVISGLTLTGQQGGVVNLRLRLTTYLHAADVNSLAPPAIAGEPTATNTGGGQ